MLDVGILFGGKSGEHEVSRCSAASVYEAIDKTKYNVKVIAIDKDGRWFPQKNPVIIEDKTFGKILDIKRSGNWYVNNYENNSKLEIYNADDGEIFSVDVVFPVIHGTNCEDGKLQGLLQLANIPYVGADVIGSAVGMDKDVAKRLLRDSSIPVVPWIKVDHHQWKNNRDFLIQEAAMQIGFPCFIKPANAGSSVGIYKVKSIDDLGSSIDLSFQYDSKILIERAVSAKEVECAVFGNYNIEASVLGEIIPEHEFYSYEAKYVDEKGASMNIPAELPEALSEKIRNIAVDAYKCLCLKGMARVDFFVDLDTFEFYLNEVNTLPGFTSISMYPKLWEKTGLPYKKLIDKLIEFAVERYSVEKFIKTEVEA